jgi:hypothetical protein
MDCHKTYSRIKCAAFASAVALQDAAAPPSAIYGDLNSLKMHAREEWRQAFPMVAIAPAIRILNGATNVNAHIHDRSMVSCW